MKKFILLFLMLFGAIGFAQHTTLKGNGVDHPTHYNPYQKVKAGVLTESQQAAEANMKNLGENKPFFVSEQQIKPKTVTSKAESAAIGADTQGVGENNPTFVNARKNSSEVAATQSLEQSVVRPLERGLFGTSGFSTSGVEGRLSTNPAAGTASFNGTANRPEASVVITHSTTQNILAGNSVTCNAGNVPDENSFFRDFDLATDFGITDDFNVTSAEFAVEDSAGPTNLTINIYSTSTAFPGGYPGSATLQGTASYVSGASDTGTVVSVPITATIPAGEIMIYELKINAGATFAWFPGSNDDGQTGVSWIMSVACGISAPTNLADIGFPEQHMVMNIVGEEGTGGGGGIVYCIPEGTNSSRFIDNFSTTDGSDNISNMGSGFSPSGYGDFYDTHTVAQEKGETVQFSVDIMGGTAGFRVWVDWNQDGVFDETLEVAYSSTGYQNSQTGTITVPTDALEGDTRMRIVSHWLSTSGDVDPCKTGFTYGEFEDYKFTVEAGGGGGGGTCANPVLEVNQDVDDTCMAFMAPGIAQSYIPLETAAAGAGIKFTDPSTGLNVDISLWDDLPNAGGVMLTSGTTTTDGTNWADVMYDDVANVTVGNTYYIVIEGDATLPCLAGSTNNPYPGGMTYANNFSSFPNFDYTFRTYSCDGGGGGTTACSQDNPENAFENAFTTSKDGAQVIATDINVPADTDFSLEKMKVNIWMAPGATLTSADITFYDNDSGNDLPDTVRSTYPAVVPVSQTVIGSNFGFDISEVVFEISPEMLPGTAGAVSRYWVSLYLDISTGSGYIGSTSATIEGVQSAFSSDSGATWDVNAGWDTVYVFEGLCEPMGGGGTGGPCATTAPSNGFEDGKSFTKNLGRIVANDLTVVDGDDMLLESITFSAFIGSTGSGVNADNVDVFIYEDNGSGAPGALLGTPQLGVVPASQTIIGNNFGYEAWSVVLDIADVNLPGQTGSDTTYWIGLSLEPTDGSNTFWEYSSAGVIGYGLGYNDGSGFVMEPANEGVYSFDGTCSSAGGGGGISCDINGPSNNMEDGKSFTKNLGRVVANDITVADGDDMLLESITISAFIGATGSGVNAANVDVFIYEDNGSGAPGALWGTPQLNLVPDSQTVIGNNFGYELWSVELDIADVNLPGQTGAATTYWVGLSLEPTDGSNTFWEYSSAGVIGYGLGYNDGSGFVMEPGNEGVYTFAGTCSIGGGGIPNDECSGAIAVSCGDSVSGTTVGATIDSGAPTCGPSVTSPGVWYSFNDTSGVAGNITVSLCNGTSFDSKLSIYSGTCAALVCVDGNDDSCGLQSEVTFSSDGNTKYYILVHSFGGETGTFTLDVTCEVIGISENVFDGFSYYPNPTSDILNLKSINNIESVSLFNLLGQRVIDNKVNATTSTVDVSGLSTGTYLMKVTVNGQTGTYKVLKQ